MTQMAALEKSGALHGRIAVAAGLYNDAAGAADDGGGGATKKDDVLDRN
jgi:hypothetical protein